MPWGFNPSTSSVARGSGKSRRNCFRSAAGRASVRAASAAASGVAISAASFWVAALAWPASRWAGSLAEFASPRLLMTIVLANAVVIIAGYFGGAAVVWGMADATMAQPR